jgi:hypothetical protein
MEEKAEVKAIELVRHIRDEQGELLTGKSPEEIIGFFRQAGAVAREKAHLQIFTDKCNLVERRDQ